MKNYYIYTKVNLGFMGPVGTGYRIFYKAREGEREERGREENLT